ncbi:MAG: PKD domain-containing protein [Pseudomonadota bacterium]
MSVEVVVVSALEQIVIEAPGEFSVVEGTNRFEIIELAKQGPKGAKGEDGAGGVQSLVPGTNVTIDDSDPAHPVINVTGGGALDPVTLKKINDLHAYATNFAGWNFDPPEIDPGSILLDPQGGTVLYTGIPLQLQYQPQSGELQESSLVQVDWGDGSPVEEFVRLDGNPSHTYTSPGVVTIRIRVSNLFGWGGWASNDQTLSLAVPISDNTWVFALDGGATLSADGTLNAAELSDSDMSAGSVLALDTGGRISVDFGQRIDLLEIRVRRRPNNDLGTWQWTNYFFDAQVEDIENPGTWLTCNWGFENNTPPDPGAVATLRVQPGHNFRLSQKMRFPMNAGVCLGGITFVGFEVHGA